MSALELARLQFGVTTVFHFLFVPATIGLTLFVAVCQTLHHRTGREVYARMTQFWGRLMLISFAIGVVTGIVQEFQFGMNWSTYSRYVGDIFGAPLAMEGLAAFFLESTFAGLWLFGRGKISPKLHLASIWALAGGTMLSAYFILAANSWMQHPVGYKLGEKGRPEMTSIFDVLTNSTALYAFSHTILAALTTAGMLCLGVCAWHLLRRNDVDLFTRAARILAPAVCAAAVLAAIVGHFQGMLLEHQQPMKMAAAEALFETEKPAGFSLFATGDLARDPGHTNVNVTVPHTLSLLATGSFNGRVRGINDIEREYTRRYGPGEYVPVVAVTYWTFRAMVGAGTLIILLSGFGFWLLRRRSLVDSRRFLKLMLPAIALPFIANSAGWIFTEMGRQPWAIQGLLRVDQSNSPTVSAAQVWLTLVGYTVIYGVLAVIGGRLFLREAKHGPREEVPPPEPDRPDLALAY